MQKTTLALHNFNIKQYENFSAILTLSVMSLHDNWRLVDEKEATVIFVASETSLTQVQWDEIQASYPHTILVAYSDNLKLLNVKKELLTPLARLPSRSDLIVLLNEIAVELDEKSKKTETSILSEAFDTTEIENIKPTEGVTYDLIDEVVINESNEPTVKTENRYFLPNDYFLGFVLESIKGEQAYACKGDNGTLIYLDPQQKKYFYSIEKKALKALFLMPSKKFTLIKLTQLEIKQKTQGMTAHTLNDLLWRATINASQGRLMEGFEFNDVIHLRHWPDIAHIKMVDNYLIIAAFMTRNTVDLETIIGHTEQQRGDVVDFHNGCHILGLIDRGKAFSLNSKPVSDKLRQLRGRIFETLRLNVVDG